LLGLSEDELMFLTKTLQGYVDKKNSDLVSKPVRAKTPIP